MMIASLCPVIAGCGLFQNIDIEQEEGRDLGASYEDAARSSAEMTRSDLPQDLVSSPDGEGEMNVKRFTQDRLIDVAQARATSWEQGACITVPDQGAWRIEFGATPALEQSAMTLSSSKSPLIELEWERGPFALPIKDGLWLSPWPTEGESIYGLWSWVLQSEQGLIHTTSVQIAPRVELDLDASALQQIGQWAMRGDDEFITGEAGQPAPFVNPYAANAAPATFALSVPYAGRYELSARVKNLSATEGARLHLRADSQRFITRALAPDEALLGEGQRSDTGALLAEIYLEAGEHLFSVAGEGTVELEALRLRGGCGELARGLAPLGGVFVSPGASALGANGSLSNPFPLGAVLEDEANALVEPGQTVWLRGGTYRGVWEARLAGRADRPVTFRSYPGELAIFDDAREAEEDANAALYLLSILGAHTVWEDLEFTSSLAASHRVRRNNQGGIPAGVLVDARDVTLRRLAIHDTRLGVTRAASAEGRFVMEDNLLYNLGTYEKDDDKPVERSFGTSVIAEQGTTSDALTICSNVFFGSLDGRVSYRNLTDTFAAPEIEGNTWFRGRLILDGDQLVGPTYTLSENWFVGAGLSLSRRLSGHRVTVERSLFLAALISFGEIQQLTIQDNRFFQLNQSSFDYIIQIMPSADSQSTLLFDEDADQTFTIDRNRYEHAQFSFAHGAGVGWSEESRVRHDWARWQQEGYDLNGSVSAEWPERPGRLDPARLLATRRGALHGARAQAKGSRSPRDHGRARRAARDQSGRHDTDHPRARSARRGPSPERHRLRRRAERGRVAAQEFKPRVVPRRAGRLRRRLLPERRGRPRVRLLYRADAARWFKLRL